MQVTKRNSEKAEFDAEKINKVLLWATENLSGVSASDVAMNAQLQFFSGIKTSQIHEVLIQSAVDLISEKQPNYQYVASNLLNYLLRKDVFSSVQETMPHLYDVIIKNVSLGVYDYIILEKYTPEVISVLNLYMKHSRDYDFTYAGLQQLIDKYLVQDRKTKKVFETPQYAYMLIAMTAYMNYEKDDKLIMIKELYDLLSEQKISIPTPQMAGIRTPNRQYSSCVLIETGDNLDSICHMNTAVTKYVAKRAGIGINMGKIRSIGSRVRNGEIVHTGVIPFLKQAESSVHSCSQGGLRKGAANTFFPWWHKEIEDIIVLKNNKGTDDNRVRHLDYTVQMNRLFYKRFLANEEVALFSPSEVPGLYDAFEDNDKFEELYAKYEKDKKINKKVINCRDLLNNIVQERLNTGRIYIMNIDNVNNNSAFQEFISMSNLCVEITLPTKELSSIYDIDSDNRTEDLSSGEIALCVLAAYNLGNIKNMEELYRCSKHIVRLEDFVIEHQDYPINASRKMLKRRSIGVGIINFAYWLAKQGLKYTDNEALEKADELFEHMQYSLIKESCELAKELGPCEWFNKTTYSQGIMPVDRYNKNVDSIVSRKPTCDWDGLRADVLQYGMRNSCLSCQFPSESSSVVQNATNGFNPVPALVTTKKSKSGLIKQVVPEIGRLKNKYQLAFDMGSNKGYTNLCAVMQKWIDQSISAEHYYEYNEEGTSIGTVIKDILYAYKMGLKTLYYAKTDDKKQDDTDQLDAGCESGACAL